MDGLEFADTLEPLGIAVGALVILIALGTLAGTPWTTARSGGAVVVQVVGVVLSVAIGAGLIWLSYEG